MYLPNSLYFYIIYCLVLRLEKAVIPIQKAFGKKKPAPRFDLKSIKIMKTCAPWKLDEPLKNKKSSKGSPPQIPFVSRGGKRGARGPFNYILQCSYLLNLIETTKNLETSQQIFNKYSNLIPWFVLIHSIYRFDIEYYNIKYILKTQ